MLDDNIERAKRYVDSLNKFSGNKEIDRRMPKIIKNIFKNGWYECSWDDLKAPIKNLEEIIIAACCDERLNERISPRQFQEAVMKIQSNVRTSIQGMKKEQLKSFFENTIALIECNDKGISAT